MGSSSLLDIVGSIVVGAMLMVNLMNINDSAVEFNFRSNGELRVQENLSSIVELVEYDFRKIGYCADWKKIPDPTQSILYADSTALSYLTDIDNDAQLDTMVYFLGPTSDLQETPNPHDRYLYRVVNSEHPVKVNLGVTQFDMMYFDALGDTVDFPISTPSQIYTIQIDITVQDPFGYDDEFSSSFWRQVRLSARNLKNR
jgi:hypothetical protein